MHATLPVWRDQSPGQREATLRRLRFDLDVYAKLCAVTVPEDVPLMDSDARRERILAGYRSVMGGALADLLNQLSYVIPADDSERLSIAAAKRLIEQNPNALNMNCEAGHVTGSGLVIDPARGRVLLHLHRKLGLWLQFGGHPDYETRIEEVALRECVEESGLTDLRIVPPGSDPAIPFDVDTHVIPEKGDRPRHLHADMRFLFETSHPDAISSGEGESADFWWLGFDEALSQPDSVIEPSVKRMIAKARDLVAHRLCG